MLNYRDTVLSLSQSMAASFNGPVWDVRGMECGSIEVAWTGFTNAAADATLKIEVSNSQVCWCPYTNSEFTIPIADVAECHMFEFGETGFKYMRVTYTAGSATAGSITMIGTMKVQLDNGILGSP